MRVVLSVLGWTLLCMLALILLALVLPVRAAIEYREGALSVQIRCLGLRFRAYSLSERWKKRGLSKRAPKERKKRRAEGGKKNKPSLEWADLQGLLGMAGTFTRRALRAIHITDIILIVPVHRDDAAQTALACGKTEAWLGGAAALLQNFMELRWIELRVLPDFTDEIKAGVYLSCKVGARPIAFLIAGVHALAYLVKKEESPPAAARSGTRA